MRLRPVHRSPRFSLAPRVERGPGDEANQRVFPWLICAGLLVLILVMTFTAGSTGLIHAQGDPPPTPTQFPTYTPDPGSTPDIDPEIESLIVQVTGARAQLESFGTFVEEMTLTRDQRLGIAVGRQAQSAAQHVLLDRRAVIIRTDTGRDVQANLRMTLTDEGGPGIGRVAPVVINAEVRRVDGVLYVKAAYEMPSPDLPALPRGWVVIDQPEQATAYAANLDLGDLVNSDTLLDNGDLLRATVTDAKRRDITQADGRALTFITLTIGYESLAAVMGQSSDTSLESGIAAAMRDALDDSSGIQIEATLDAEGRPVAFRTVIDLHATGIDANALDPERFPRGVRLDLTLTTTRHERYSQINQPQAGITAPRLY